MIPFQVVRASQRKTRPMVAKRASIPAPVGGWNARDSIADMEAMDAYILDNFFPTTSDILLRRGWAEHATGVGGDQVESLMAYNAQNGTQLLFAAADDTIYDVTDDTSSSSAEVTGLTNARFQHVNFTNSSGDSYLINVNGADLALYYNGTNWMSVSDTSTPGIIGVDTDKLIGVTVHKRRVWFVEKNSLRAWYLPVDSVGGTARSLDLSGIAKFGGSLTAINTWTIDAGEGVDDYWVSVTDQGEVIVYQGTDPNSEATWGMVGVWKLGEPIGRRCFMKWGGDLLLISIDGVFPLAKALQSSRVNPRVALTDKINGAMSSAGELYRINFGWQLAFFPKANMLILNVPVTAGAAQQQFVMNTITGSWGRFLALSANCWEVFGEDLYFGGNGYVAKFWGVLDDNGSNIVADGAQAFNYFGSRGLLKRWTMGRPILLSNGLPSALLSINVDFDTAAPTESLTFTPPHYALWDVDLWDVGIWGGGLGVLRDWQGLSGMGFCASPRLSVTAQGIDVRWESTDFFFEPGQTI